MQIQLPYRTRVRSPQLSSRTGRMSLPLIIGSILWVVVFVALFVIWQLRSDLVTAASQSAQPADVGDDTAAAAVAIPEASVKLSFPARTLPDFEFQEADGGTVSLQDLQGKPWVASFVFTRCVTTCPTITLAMKRLHDRVIADNSEVVFVTFTVDPEYDTVEVLQQYSEAFSPDRERWKFLTGTQDKLFSLILNGFGLYVKENIGESRRPGFEVAHSNRVVLVNEDAVPVGTFLATRDEDMVELRKILTDRKPFPEPGPPLTIQNADGSPAPVELELREVETEPAEAGTPEEAAPEAAAPAKADGDDTAVLNRAAVDAVVDDTVAADSAGAAAASDFSIAEHNARIERLLPDWARSLPVVNASLNGLATCLLASGWVAVRNRHLHTHRNLMISAFVTSVIFLCSYLTYHYALGRYTGQHGRRFSGEGIWASVYPLVLWPHVALAACVPVLAIRVFQHAFAQRWDAHKRLARVTFPIWMYVSVTGVVIYGMLYHWPAPASA